MTAQIQRRDRGFTLIEVMVALLVFSLGVLGLVALQAKASAYSVDAEDRTRAALLAADLVSAMWAQHSASLPSDVLDAWNSRLTDVQAGGLPGGKLAGLTTDSQGVTKITITWAEPARVRIDGPSRYVTQVVIR